MSSLFTKILNQEIPAEILWQDDHHFAILDINPNNPGHLLVIPKKEVGYIFDLSDDEYQALFLVIKKISKKLLEITKAKRIGLVIEGLGIEDHAHVHLIPINNVGELDSLHKIKMSSEEMAEMAEKIKVALNA